MKSRQPIAKNNSKSRPHILSATQLVEKEPTLRRIYCRTLVEHCCYTDTLAFLTTLRKKMLGWQTSSLGRHYDSCETRDANDVNELLLLYSFVFSPSESQL